MADWVGLCAMEEAPPVGEVRELEAHGQMLCLANVEGVLHVLDNLCPHRQGPLGQGWVEGNAVICPWHAWAFDSQTGIAEEPEKAQVKVYPVKAESGQILVDLA